jgi:hypothetical protein
MNHKESGVCAAQPEDDSKTGRDSEALRVKPVDCPSTALDQDRDVDHANRALAKSWAQ